MLNSASALPLYHQLKTRLRQEIRSGTWQPGEAIPSERELIQQFGVSRTTVRQALADLVHDGVLFRQHGRGTFVAQTQPIVNSLSTLQGHVEELQLQGYQPEVRVEHIGYDAAPAEVVAALHLAEGETALVVHRLVTVDTAPLVKLDVWLPLSLGVQVTAEQLASTPMYRLLEEQGVFPAYGRQRVRAVPAPASEADLLGIAPGHPALEVVRIVYGAGDRPIEWSRALYHPDRYEYVVDLRRREERP